MTLRQRVYQKHNGHCAYCGDPITIQGMRVDHLRPIYRGREEKPVHAGKDIEANMMPACISCNSWKTVLGIEMFRAEIEAQVLRLRRDSAAFRLAERYGLVSATGEPVTFYFERSHTN